MKIIRRIEVAVSMFEYYALTFQSAPAVIRKTVDCVILNILDQGCPNFFSKNGYQVL